MIRDRRFAIEPPICDRSPVRLVDVDPENMPTEALVVMYREVAAAAHERGDCNARWADWERAERAARGLKG